MSKNIKVVSGFINIVPTAEQFEAIKAGTLSPKDVNVENGVRKYTKDGVEHEYIVVTLSSKNKEDESKYDTSIQISCFAKQFRIIQELGKAPATIAYEETVKDGFTNGTAVAIQNDKLGKIEQ